MKNLAAFLIMFIASVSILEAQVELKGLIGTNFATFSEAPTDYDVKGTAGYQFGAGVLIGNKFYVEPGIQFVHNSRMLTSTTSESDVEFDQNFLKIPVYLGYHLFGHESDKLALRIFAGPAVSVAGKITKGEDQISKDDIENATWMLDGGLGLDIFFLFVEASYEIGLNDVFTNPSIDSKHKGFVLNGGIHFDF